MRDRMEYETGRDIIDNDYQQYVDAPNSITVTGEEWWLKHFGLTEELLWPQEEVDDSSILQIYKNTPWSSLNVSISGEDIDETRYSEGQTILGEMIEAPKSNRWNQRCMTNMVRANTDITGYDRKTVKETDRRCYGGHTHGWPT